MDYLVVIKRPDGDISTHPCATLTDVTNTIHSTMRSLFAKDINLNSIEITVANYAA